MRSRSSWTWLRSSTRRTTLSPNMVGSTATRRSTGLPVDQQLDAAVLRHAPLGDVQVGHDLDAAGDGHGDVLGRREHLVQHAVDAVPHVVLIFEGLEVDVRGLVADGLEQHRVDQLFDGVGIGGGA